MSGKYAVILADPPWQGYETAHWRARWNGRKTLPEGHYITLQPSDIARLPIAPLAAKNSALFLWTTTARLPDALEIIKAWRFRFAGVGFTWVKMNHKGEPLMGMGQYTRNNAELCLLSIRGSVPRRAKDVRQVILSCRRQHSRKPDEQYERIMRLFDGPYLELFARQQWPGWDVWGNEAGKFPAQPFLFSETATAAGSARSQPIGKKASA